MWQLSCTKSLLASNLGIHNITLLQGGERYWPRCNDIIIHVTKCSVLTLEGEAAIFVAFISVIFCSFPLFFCLVERGWVEESSGAAMICIHTAAMSDYKHRQNSYTSMLHVHER